MGNSSFTRTLIKGISYLLHIIKIVFEDKVHSMNIYCNTEHTGSRLANKLQLKSVYLSPTSVVEYNVRNFTS
jgi:hypothetical protein